MKENNGRRLYQLFSLRIVNKKSYSFDFEAEIKQSLPCLQIFRVTGVWRRIADRWQKVVPILLADCSVFLGERDWVEHHSGLLCRFACFVGWYPWQIQGRLWIEQSFAMPSTLPTAPMLTSPSAPLLYSLGSCFSSFSRAVVHVTITVISKSVIGEETKRTYMINMWYHD